MLRISKIGRVKTVKALNWTVGQFIFLNTSKNISSDL